jgi:hypothetical protein
MLIRPRNNLIGLQFGRLTVLKQAKDYVPPSGKHMTMWLCECSCEEQNQIVVRGGDLKSGNTKSCGCLAQENRKTINKKQNRYDLSGEFGVIWSTNTNEEVYFDLDDAEKILQYGWGIGRDGYPTAYVNGEMIRMHVFLGYKRHDHHNRNKKDNRKENLIPCTVQENSRNRSITSKNISGFIGVYWSKQSQRWRAQVKIDRKTLDLGGFIDKEDAIRARLQAEAKYYGEFAPQRHLFEQYNIKYNTK